MCAAQCYNTQSQWPPTQQMYTRLPGQLIKVLVNGQKQ